MHAPPEPLKQRCARAIFAREAALADFLGADVTVRLSTKRTNLVDDAHHQFATLCSSFARENPHIPSVGPFRFVYHTLLRIHPFCLSSFAHSAVGLCLCRTRARRDSVNRPISTSRTGASVLDFAFHRRRPIFIIERSQSTGLVSQGQ